MDGWLRCCCDEEEECYGKTLFSKSGCMVMLYLPGQPLLFSISVILGICNLQEVVRSVCVLKH